MDIGKVKKADRQDMGCAVCGRWPVEEHHIFPGPNRKWSDRYNLVVYLCGEHHRYGQDAAHANRGFAARLKQDGQRKFEETHTRAEFMKIFGRNYL